MARFSGKIGFATTSESVSEPSVYEETITERKYTGFILTEYNNHNDKTTINTDVRLNMRFSIIMDPYTAQNINNLRYIEYMGTKWKISSVEVKLPGLIISIGDMWNG